MKMTSPNWPAGGLMVGTDNATLAHEAAFEYYATPAQGSAVKRGPLTTVER